MKIVALSLMTWILVACSAGPDSKSEVTTHSKQANADRAPSPSSLESDSSEGVVGPDDAYFAGVFLESVFKASQSNPHPTLNRSLSLGKEKSVEAFDFAANFQAKRLGLMSRILINLGDKDMDRLLSSEEFLAVQLIPELKGSIEWLRHDFDKELFDAAAGTDDLLSADEIKELLAQVAEHSPLAKLSKKEIRKALESGWEKVLEAYDADKDGKLSLEERKKLRKDRSAIIGRFAAQ